MPFARCYRPYTCFCRVALIFYSLSSGFPLLRVEFSLKTDSVYPKDTGVTLFTLATPGNPLCYNTRQLLLSPPSPIPGKRSQSLVDMPEHRDTYGQAQVCSKGHQGSSAQRGVPEWCEFYFTKDKRGLCITK